MHDLLKKIDIETFGDFIKTILSKELIYVSSNCYISFSDDKGFFVFDEKYETITELINNPFMYYNNNKSKLFVKKSIIELFPINKELDKCFLIFNDVGRPVLIKRIVKSEDGKFILHTDTGKGYPLEICTFIDENNIKEFLIHRQIKSLA